MPEHPQTIGFALADSPVGLAAWMLDHDADSYRKISASLRRRESHGWPHPRQGPGQHHADLADGTGASSARIYWEEGRSTVAAIAAGQKPPKLALPVAFTVFPDELFKAPRRWAEKVYPNLIYFNEVDKGGHFAAWEEPEIFASELREGFRSLR